MPKSPWTNVVVRYNAMDLDRLLLAMQDLLVVGAIKLASPHEIPFLRQYCILAHDDAISELLVMPILVLIVRTYNLNLKAKLY